MRTNTVPVIPVIKQAAQQHGFLTHTRIRFENLREQAYVLEEKARKAVHSLIGAQPESGSKPTGGEVPSASWFDSELNVIAQNIENTFSEIHAQLDRINEALS
jgi:hypothetical protein